MIEVQELLEIAELSEKVVLSSEDNLKDFLAFAARFSQFSYYNLLLFYTFVPNAVNIATYHSVKALEKVGFQVEIDAESVPYLSPEVSDEKIKYVVRGAYSFLIKSTADYVVYDLANEVLQLDDLIMAYRSLTGVNVMDTDDEYEDGMCFAHNSLIYPSRWSAEDKINTIISRFSSHEALDDKDDRLSRAPAAAEIKYLYYMRYPPAEDNRGVIPSSLKFCLLGDKERIKYTLNYSITQFKYLTDRMRKPQIVARKSDRKTRKQELPKEGILWKQNNKIKRIELEP